MQPVTLQSPEMDLRLSSRRDGRAAASRSRGVCSGFELLASMSGLGEGALRFARGEVGHQSPEPIMARVASLAPASGTRSSRLTTLHLAFQSQILHFSFQHLRVEAPVHPILNHLKKTLGLGIISLS